MPPTAPLRVPVELRPAGASAGAIGPKPVKTVGAGGPRCFRTAVAISVEGLALAIEAPEWMGRGRDAPPLDVRFYLPDDDPAPIEARARVIEVAPDETSGESGEAGEAGRSSNPGKAHRADHDDRPRAKALRFLALDEALADRIARYVEARNLLG